MSRLSNTFHVNLIDGRIVLYSYDVPVAAFIPNRGYVGTSKRYSVTTSRHVNQFASRKVEIVSPDVFAGLIAPIQVID